MRFFSTTEKVELPGMALVTLSDKPSREEYLTYLRRYVRERVADFRPFHEVTAIESSSIRQQSGFAIRGMDRWHRPFDIISRAVVLATGAFDEPNLLGVPGEDLPHVSHYFSEVHPYALHRVVVVGGSSSAVETALLLWRAGARVTIVHRGAEFRTLKFWLAPDIQNRITAGEIAVHYSSRVTEITKDAVILTTPRGPVTLPTDYVLALTGYRPSTRLLEVAGAQFDPQSRRPVVNPQTLESTVPGLFLAGVLLAGDMSGEIFIENSRDHGQRILPGLLAHLGR
jgi:thioredoxin reductase (NADPH)